MDDYDLQQVLESMAHAAAPSDTDSFEIEDITRTVKRWQRLFSLSEDDAMDRILKHRNDLSRMTVSNDHWATVRAEKEAAEYDREAYEYELNLEKSKVQLESLLPVVDGADDAKLSFLLQLSGPLTDLKTVRSIAGLDHDPAVVEGSSVETWEPVTLCCIDGQAKANILRWSASIGYEPVILVDPISMQVASQECGR